MRISFKLKSNKERFLIVNDIVDFLNNSRIQYLATIGLDGKPKVRPFQFMFEMDGKLWFCTSNQKEVFKELWRVAWNWLDFA